MENFLAILLALAIHVGIPALIGLAIAGYLIPAKQPKLQARELVCTTNADCPSGYICLGGKCVLVQAS